MAFGIELLNFQPIEPNEKSKFQGIVVLRGQFRSSELPIFISKVDSIKELSHPRGKDEEVGSGWEIDSWSCMFRLLVNERYLEAFQASHFVKNLGVLTFYYFCISSKHQGGGG